MSLSLDQIISLNSEIESIVSATGKPMEQPTTFVDRHSFTYSAHELPRVKALPGHKLACESCLGWNYELGPWGIRFNYFFSEESQVREIRDEILSETQRRIEVG